MKFLKMYDAIDMHCGEPIRVITGGSGLATIPGNSVYEQMCWVREHNDDIRKLMINEPRGYPPVCVDLIVPPKHPDADIGFIIMEPCSYPMVSGGNVGCVVTAVLETGILPMKQPYTDLVLEAPGGLIRVRAACTETKVTGVTFTNVPCIAPYLDTKIQVPGIGEVVVDVAFGGMWYVHADIGQFEGIDLEPKYAKKLGELSARLILAAQEQLPVKHPNLEDPEDNKVIISFLTKALDEKTPSRHCVNAVGMLSFPDELSWDRPETLSCTLARDACGSGGSAMMAIEYFKGNLGLHEEYINESMLGISNTLEIIEKTKLGNQDAIIPNLTMQAWITGFSKYVLDETDPFPEGYQMGDIW